MTTHFSTATKFIQKYNPARDWCIVLVVLGVLGVCVASGLAWDYYFLTQAGSVGVVTIEIPKRFVINQTALKDAVAILHKRTAAHESLYQQVPVIIDPSL